MENLKIRAFGITKDILGSREVSLQISTSAFTVKDLRRELVAQYPALKELKSLMVAVNNEYAEDDQSLKPEDEIALIPPVSGG